MFAYILIFDVVSNARDLWSHFRSYLSEDFARRQGMDVSAAKVCTLSVHGHLLIDYGIDVNLDEIPIWMEEILKWMDDDDDAVD